MTKHDKEALPFVAPCHSLPLEAPINWLKKAIIDIRCAPLASFSYGLVMTLMVMVVMMTSWNTHNTWALLLLLCGFVFISPLACIGTYAISAQIERGLTVSFKRTLRACFKRYIGNELIFTLVLLVLFLVWARASSVVSIFLPINGEHQLGEILPYLLVMSAVSVLFLAILFAASVFALPMIMHRNIDAVTAIVTSINATLRNKLVMAVWAGIIALMVAIGILTGGVALVFILPLIGHAVWHGYLETVDADAFPDIWLVLLRVGAFAKLWCTVKGVESGLAEYAWRWLLNRF